MSEGKQLTPHQPGGSCNVYLAEVEMHLLEDARRVAPRGHPRDGLWLMLRLSGPRRLHRRLAVLSCVSRALLTLWQPWHDAVGLFATTLCLNDGIQSSIGQVALVGTAQPAEEEHKCVCNVVARCPSAVLKGGSGGRNLTRL